MKFLTVEEARKRLTSTEGQPLVARPQWYRLINAGVVPHVRMGRRIYIPEERFGRWLEAGGAGLEAGWRHETEAA